MSDLSLLGTPGHERTGPITDRQGADLARFYGFSDLDELAEEIPAAAEVIDIGAGFSTLGHEATKKRPDIRWINMDVAYLDRGWDKHVAKKLDGLIASAPVNLKYIGASILNPPEDLQGRRFSRIFSYYMLPHIVYNGIEYGTSAVRNMLNMGEIDGVIKIGPISDFSDDAFHLTVPSSSSDTERLAEETVLSWVSR